MRRSGTTIGIIVIVLLAIVMTGFVAYGRGETAGQKAASSDRSGFASRGTSVAGGAGGFGGRGGQGGQGVGGFGGRGGQGGQGAGGSAAAGAGTPGVAGGANGRGAAGGAVAPVAGKVTKVENGTLTLQEQPGNTTTVATNATTMVTTFALGALSDLAMGNIVAIQGDKTGDTTFTAKTIYTLNGGQTGGAGRGPGGAGATTGTDTVGTPGAGGRGSGRNASSVAGGGAPTGRGAGGGLFPGLNGPTGRITQISGGTLTLQGFDGSTTTVTTDASTSVRKQTPGALSDIKAGDMVSVQSDASGDPTAPARAVIDLGAGA